MLHKESLWLGFPVWYLGFGFAIENKTMASLIFFIQRGFLQPQKHNCSESYDYKATWEHVGQPIGIQIWCCYWKYVTTRQLIAHPWGNITTSKRIEKNKQKGSLWTQKCLSRRLRLRTQHFTVGSWRQDLGEKILEKRSWRQNLGGKIPEARSICTWSVFFLQFPTSFKSRLNFKRGLGVQMIMLLTSFSVFRTVLFLKQLQY